jgi:polyribonucleotide nucleotidyltransferase
MELIRETAKVGDLEIHFETGKLAKQTNAVVVTLGETSVLVTAAIGKEPKAVDFLPLTVEFRESNAAAGKIPGGYFRREGRPTERDILTCRVIDRPIRPLFPKAFRHEVQVIASPLANDKQNEPDVLALCGASAALMIGESPWDGPAAGIRVGRVNGKFVAFPTWEQQKRSDMNVIVACTADAIVMVEAGADQVPEADILDALWFAKDATVEIIEAQRRLAARVQKPKIPFVAKTIDPAIVAAVREIGITALRDALAISGKHARHTALKAVKAELAASLASQFPEQGADVATALDKLEVKLVREATVQGVRVDGRGLKDIRDLYIEMHPYDRPHGSAIFQRGETQAFVTTTLGTERDSLRLDTIRGDEVANFMLHYNFPPFCVGEVRALRGLARREVGHGALAQRAIAAIVPNDPNFPYTIRVVSDTLESNGSSSMAAVCGGCLALMDAGVPIKAPVAGVAMGLIQEGDRIAILSDILGDEDHLGDMDFKCCGSREGITALQMDMKVKGLTREIMSQALEQAREGRIHILDKMLAAIPAPRPDISKYAPRIVTIHVKLDKIRSIIGPGGKVIRGIQEQTGVVVNVDDTGRVTLASSDARAIERAKQIIETLTFEAEVGRCYSGVVKRIVDFGAFVEIMPGTDGLVHISELDDRKVDVVTDVVNEGDDVVVVVLEIDELGRVRLSRRKAFGVDPDEVLNLRA